MRWPRRIHGERGQTAAEYLGMLAVIALIVGVVARTTPGVVGGALSSAMCRVVGGECAAAAAGPSAAATLQPGPASRPAPAPAPPSQGGGDAGGFLDVVSSAASATGDGLVALANGFVSGDLGQRYDDPVQETLRNVGQFASGVLVFGDVRDAGAAIDRLVETGGQEGWGDLALSAAGMVPIAGDLAKGIQGGARATEAFDTAHAAARAARAAEEIRFLRGRLDGIKRQVTRPTLDAARRELKGEVVARKSSGSPYDHVYKVQRAQDGLIGLIDRSQKRLGDSRLSNEDRVAVQKVLGEVSRMLDFTEEFVPQRR
jgi:hypothetical protein